MYLQLLKVFSRLFLDYITVMSLYLPFASQSEKQCIVGWSCTGPWYIGPIERITFCFRFEGYWVQSGQY